MFGFIRRFKNAIQEEYRNNEIFRSFLIDILMILLSLFAVFLSCVYQHAFASNVEGMDIVKSITESLASGTLLSCGLIIILMLVEIVKVYKEAVNTTEPNIPTQDSEIPRPSENVQSPGPVESPESSTSRGRRRTRQRRRKNKN